MNSKDLFKGIRSEKSILDILVQIIEIYRRNINDNSFVIRPENFIVSKVNENPDTDEEYFDVSYYREMSFDKSFHPIPFNGSADEKDSIFCIGLMMYQLVTGNQPDIEKASSLEELVDKDNSFRFLTYEKAYGKKSENKSLLWDIIADSTNLNKDFRPTLNTVMKSIISAYSSVARIKIMEGSLNECLENIEIPVQSAFCIWKSKKNYEYDDKKYIPEKPDFQIEIPYRLFTKEYVCIVSDNKCPVHGQRPVRRHSGKHNIGIDFGTWNSSVSFINDNGYTENIFPDDGRIPTAIYYISKDEFIFGREAVIRQSDCAKAFSRCFKRNVETGDVIYITAENGDIIEETYYGLTVKYLRYLYGEIKKRFDLNQDNSQIVLTIPACYDPGMKTLILTAAREAGFDPDILTESEAVSFFFGTSDECEGNALVFDVGGGKTDISSISFSSSPNEEGTSVKSESIDGICRLGGEDLTNILYCNLLKSPALRNAVNMNSEEESGLNSKNFDENISVIKNAAEKIKVILSYDSKAMCDVNINVPGKAEKEKITLSMKRRAYEILIKEQVSKLKNAVSKCRASKKDIKHIIITGVVTVTPVIRNMVFSVFSEYDCEVHCVNYPDVVSGGAAIYANYLAEKNKEKQSISELTYDIGVLFAGAYGERPIFRCLAEAGTSLRDGNFTVTVVCIPTDEEKEKNYCQLFLYRRPREYHFVESTFDPEGDVICPIGTVYVSKFPEKFSLSEGRVQFSITFDSQECISAFSSFCMPENTSGTEYIIVGSEKAVFKPCMLKPDCRNQKVII